MINFGPFEKIKFLENSEFNRYRLETQESRLSALIP